MTKTINDFAADVSYGICTGGNNIFVVTKEFCVENQLESELVKNVIFGKDILPYRINYDNNNKIIYTTKSVKIENYPRIYSYLQRFEKELSKKRETQKGILPYWCLHWARKVDLFQTKKIVMRQTGDSIIAAIDTNNIYALDSVLMITLKNEYVISYKFLLAILNSRLAKFFYQEITQEQGRVFAQVKPKNIRKLFVPIVSEADKKAIESLVQKCLDAKGVGVEEWEAEIDDRVAHLYGLTDEEMKIIRGE